MSYEEEFKTVELVKSSDAETRGVDAFSLSLIKAERQARKILTHLVYQNPAFSGADIATLRDALAKNRKVYFEGFLRGIDEISPITVKALVGDAYENLLARVNTGIGHRNKIFHGQLTQHSLSRSDLIGFADDISKWCKLLSDGAMKQFEYDGFARDSFRKSTNAKIHLSFKRSPKTIKEYEYFIKKYMERP